MTALEVFGPYATVLISFLFNQDTNISWGIIIFIIPMVLFAYAYFIPLLLSLVYFIFGNNIFIFNWVDSVLVFIIQYLMSILTPTIFLISIGLQIIFWFARSDERGFASVFIIVYLLEAYYLEIATMKLSVGAIRYLSPTWDMEKPGEYLWPAVLYWLGIKEHTGG